MRLDKVVSWYQRKISTYDKQQWEKTVEQRILHGFVQAPLTNTQLKTELIDVDLVRGSSFPKAKPKQGLATVLKLSVLRYLLLPLYAKWWVEQTSPRVFTLLLFLYGLQMWCWAVYSYNIHRPDEQPEHIVSSFDLCIPMALSLVLSVIHSQIVATASIASEGAGKRGAVVTAARRRKRADRDGGRRRRWKGTVHRRGSELKFPLTVDQSSSNNTNVGTVYIHHPPSALSEQPAHDKQSASTPILPPPPNSAPDGLRKRIVNFSSHVEEPSPLLQPAQDTSDSKPPPAIDPDVVRQTRLTPKTNGAASASDQPPKSQQQNGKKPRRAADSSDDTDEEGGDDETEAGLRSPLLLHDSSLNSSTQTGAASASASASAAQYTEGGTTSATEWIGITTNSEEENSYTSDLEASDSPNDDDGSDYAGDCDFAPTVILNPCCGTNDRISCTIWEHSQTKKAEMSVLDISSAIIERVDAIPDTCEYVYIGLALSVMLSFVPMFCRICEAAATMANSAELHVMDIPGILMENTEAESSAGGMMWLVWRFAFGSTAWEQNCLVVGFLLRISLTFLFFFVLAVAERTFKQRFLYAKLFSHLTSSRRARKSKVPHFRLNKVRNIKIWLSVRSYLKRRGPQRSVDVIVSATFILTLLFLSFLSVEWLKDSVHLQSQYSLEALTWSCCLGCFLLRFMTLGTKITRKYRSLSVLITEQINLYLQIEQKPHKKEELMVANSVLKLAADLLKELESPFKISGLSANPYLYTTIKVVVLSALSGVLSEMLGFKLKLHKIKIK